MAMVTLLRDDTQKTCPAASGPTSTQGQRHQRPWGRYYRHQGGGGAGSRGSQEHLLAPVPVPAGQVPSPQVRPGGRVPTAPAHGPGRHGS